MITLSFLLACSSPAPQADVAAPPAPEAAGPAADGPVTLVVSSRGDGEIEPCG